MRPGLGRGWLRAVNLILALCLLAAGQVPPNPGVRHQPAEALSAQARAYYTGDRAFSVLRACSAETEENGWDSPLRAALRDAMAPEALDSYAAALNWLPLTDTEGAGETPLLFYADGAGQWNREEVWPEPRGNYYREGPGADLHHLRAADPQGNWIRGDMTFGSVRDTGGGFQTWTRGEEPVFWYLPDWNNGAGLVEVRDQVKGDVARILLYVYTCYGSGDEYRNLFTDEPVSGAGLTLNEGLRVVESLDTLLAWCALDPVDEWEMGRNDTVQDIQGNRNVFIDYPELAWLLFARPIPDIPTPSGYAHSLTAAVTALAQPPEGGSLSVSGWTVTASPAEGWVTAGWSLDPAEAGAVTWEGNVFTLSDLAGDCTLTVNFAPEDPCAQGHSWDEGTVTQNPGCETPGQRTFHCQICSAEREEPIPALGHKWESRTVPPSCTQPGYTDTYCPRCGQTSRSFGDPALGHDWDEGSLTREPTQTEPGEWTSQCRRCGLWKREAVPFRFADVADPTRFYYEAVYWALAQTPPITTGVDETRFAPGKKCSRAEVVTFLWRAAGCPAAETTAAFPDVKPGAYYFQAVSWALEAGITTGTDRGTFAPNQVCTRCQVATFLWRAAGCPQPQGNHLPFTDVNPSSYYAQAVLWALEEGVTTGTGAKTFSPNAPCTRGEVVTFLYRSMGPE